MNALGKKSVSRTTRTRGVSLLLFLLRLGFARLDFTPHLRPHPSQRVVDVCLNCFIRHVDVPRLDARHSLREHLLFAPRDFFLNLLHKDFWTH